MTSCTPVSASFFAQPVAHHLDGFGQHIQLARKHHLEQPLLGDGVAGLGQQRTQQGQLARRQLQRLAVYVHRALSAIHLQTAERRGEREPKAGLPIGPKAERWSGCGCLQAAAAQQGLDAAFQLVQVKRFGQVVVGPGVQAQDGSPTVRVRWG